MISLISKMAPFLKQGVSATVALSGLQRVDPKIKRFIEGSVVAGYGADSIIEFLRNQTISEGKRATESRLQERTSQGVARPDEMAANQQFSQERKGRQLVGQAAGLAGGIGSLLSSFGGGGQGAVTPEVLGPEQALQAQQQMGLPGPGQQQQIAQQARPMPQPPQGGGIPPQQPTPPGPQAPQEKPRAMKDLSPVAYDKTVISKAFKDSGIDKVITRMFEAGEPIQKISSYISDVYPPTAISLEKNLGRPLEESISLFLGRKGKKGKGEVVEAVAETVAQGPSGSSSDALLQSIQALSAAFKASRGQQ